MLSTPFLQPFLDDNREVCEGLWKFKSFEYENRSLQNLESFCIRQRELESKSVVGIVNLPSIYSMQKDATNHEKFCSRVLSKWMYLFVEVASFQNQTSENKIQMSVYFKNQISKEIVYFGGISDV